MCTEDCLAPPPMGPPFTSRHKIQRRFHFDSHSPSSFALAQSKNINPKYIYIIHIVNKHIGTSATNDVNSVITRESG
jgi:hypothetical protein